MWRSAADALADCNENLRDNLVETSQIRPANADDAPPGQLEEARSTLLRLDSLVHFLNAVAVLDASIELDGDFQTGNRDINEEGVPAAVHFFLRGNSLDSCQDQSVENARFSRRLASGIRVGNDPSRLACAAT